MINQKEFNRRLNWIILIIGVIVLLNLLSIALTLFTPLSYLESLRITFGSFYVLFLPGFILSFIFFPKNKDIEVIERLALSFALSISVVPLAVFYLNLIGVKISLLSSFFTILAIIVLSLIIIYVRLKKNKDF